MSEDVIEVYGLDDDELEAMPLFPLPSVVLLPGAAVGLHLFEPRYRALARDSLGPDGTKVIAICAFEAGWEGQYEGRPPLRKVAGAGRIVQHRENADGTFDVVVVGVGRVALDELPDDGRLYRRARAVAIEEEVDESAVRSARTELLTLLRALGVDVPDLPERLEDESPVFADQIAQVIVTENEARQTLLEMPNVAARLRYVADVAARQTLGSRGPARILN